MCSSGGVDQRVGGFHFRVEREGPNAAITVTVGAGESKKGAGGLEGEVL